MNFQAVLRRCPKPYRSHLKMNPEEKAAAYKEYLEKEAGEEPKVIQERSLDGSFLLFLLGICVDAEYLIIFLCWDWSLD